MNGIVLTIYVAQILQIYCQIVSDPWKMHYFWRIQHSPEGIFEESGNIAYYLVPSHIVVQPVTSTLFFPLAGDTIVFSLESFSSPGMEWTKLSNRRVKDKNQLPIFLLPNCDASSTSNAMKFLDRLNRTHSRFILALLLHCSRLALHFKVFCYLALNKCASVFVEWSVPQFSWMSSCGLV